MAFRPDVTAVAVIPARGGSKGLPRKNVTPVGGVPLVVRAVRSCLQATLIAQVVVSTDDAEIATLAEEAGATIVWRPPTLSGDGASSESAVRHTLDTLVSDGRPLPDVTLLIQCTSPFIAPSDLDQMVEMIDQARFDCCLTVAESHRFLWHQDPDGQGLGVNHDPGVRLPRQDLKPEFVETGSAYAFRTDGFLESGHRFFGRIGLVSVDRLTSVEIDDIDDLRIAEVLSRVVGGASSGSQAAKLPTHVEAVVFDFDGVMTDDRVLVLSDGSEGVMASRSDGMGITRLREIDSIRLLVLSKERNPVVQRRCEKLGIECLSGIDDKQAALKEWLSKGQVSAPDVIYVGNDINDLDCMAMVGCSVAPADAHPQVRDIAHIVLERSGGRGAVRELAELIIGSRVAP